MIGNRRRHLPAEEILAMVLNDEVQVGLVRTLRHPDIDSIPLYEDELVLVCNTQHRFSRRGSVELAEVGRERLVRTARHVHNAIEERRPVAVADERAVLVSEVRGEATCCHRGRTTWVWDVRLTDGVGRLCAVSRVTVAVRPARPG